MLGLIATPILLVNAFSPTVFALIVEQIGWQNAFNALLVCAILSWLAIELMSRRYERTHSPLQPSWGGDQSLRFVAAWLRSAA